jgi:hypothetical protein
MNSTTAMLWPKLNFHVHPYCKGGPKVSIWGVGGQRKAPLCFYWGLPNVSKNIIMKSGSIKKTTLGAPLK